MRSDMSKVIVERARPGSARHVPRRARRLDPKRIAVGEDEDDFLPRRIGHKRAASSLGWDRKVLNENLAPLRRYLGKQVGRPWDKVWSQISSNVRPDDTVQQHVRDHVQDFVAYRTFLKDGAIFVAERRGGRPVPLSELRWIKLYVDPRTGLLRRMKAVGPSRRQRREQKAAAERELGARLRVIARDRELHLLDDGNWWEVTLAARPCRLPNGEAVDVVDSAGLSSLPREMRYTRPSAYAVAKRALSRKEIKALRLRG